MSRPTSLLMAAAVAAAVVGCAHCDTCDDFPAPCADCGYTTPDLVGAPMGAPMGAPGMMPGGPIIEDSGLPYTTTPPSINSAPASPSLAPPANGSGAAAPKPPTTSGNTTPSGGAEVPPIPPLPDAGSPF